MDGSLGSIRPSDSLGFSAGAVPWGPSPWTTAVPVPGNTEPRSHLQLHSDDEDTGLIQPRHRIHIHHHIARGSSSDMYNPSSWQQSRRRDDTMASSASGARLRVTVQVNIRIEGKHQIGVYSRPSFGRRGHKM
ncbi:hypothetical protein EYF80_012889 [Liparis tanakae]|uniref:Uncharacterized protein n=1 Tax=Liparis tanakae TaxID=230148 RepID=A0A4Z2IFT6_9TELE|nr:hypothetical protein EYF80_012889 [Liparis tanakae]